MKAVYATGPRPSDPLGAVAVGERPEPVPAREWTTVRVRAVSLNGHDVATLRGVGIGPGSFPMILGCDGAGLDPDGNRVLVYPVIDEPGWDGEDTLSPGRHVLSERVDGTMCELVAVPARNVVPLPPWLTFAEGACVGTAWLTAYRMLFTLSSLQAGDTVLIQGCGGGLAQALIALARVGGFRVWATGRAPAAREKARELGAHRVFEPRARLPHQVNAVMDSVGLATWRHSVEALRPGGTLVLAGVTTGANPPAKLGHVFFRQLTVVGAFAGTRQELRRLISLLEVWGVRPYIDKEYALCEAPEALARMASGDINGKLVVLPAE